MKKNITPIIGMISGMILIIWSITTSGDIISFIDIPSLVITVVGSLCGLLVIFSLDDLKKVPKLLKVLISTPSTDKIQIVKTFLELSKKARTNGILSLEDEIENLDNDIMSEGLQMVIDGTEPDQVQDMLDLKLAAIERRHGKGQEIFTQWGELAPAFGMLGTLIGLVIMLSDLDDPSGIGSGMATALLTTFYGSLFANLFFIPIAANLGDKTEEEMYVGTMIVEGVLEIQSGSNSRLLEEKLLNYLSPAEREAYETTDMNVSEEKAYE